MSPDMPQIRLEKVFTSGNIYRFPKVPVGYLRFFELNSIEFVEYHFQ